jgi:glucokinase
MADRSRARLIADIGGTNARFALAGPAGFTQVRVLPVAGHDGFGAALDVYLAGGDEGFVGDRTIGSVAIAAAGPRDGNAVSLTNAPWRIDGAAVSARLGGIPVRVLNDLEAVALCLPGLGSDDREVLTPGLIPGATEGPLPMLAANVGTGFGAAVAVPSLGRAGWTVLGTEAGHMSLAPLGPAEAALLASVRTVEDAFSGPGYARLFGAATADDGESLRPGGPGDDDAPAGARSAYSGIFGRVLGDLALATGAWGGVYLTGGVMSDFHRVIDVETMLAAFRDKDKMASRMERVPVFRITADQPAFRGLSAVEVA